jgi:putative ABC transport system permease protein
MRPLDLVHSALRALRAHKLRSFLTLLGVIIGVTTMVSVVGVIAGLDAYVKDQIIRLAPDVFVVDRFGIIQSHSEFIQALKRPSLTWADYERVSQAGLPHVAQVSTRAFRSMTVKFRDKHLANVFVVGTTANFAGMLKFETESGRYFSEQENQAAAYVAVIGADTRDELFPHLDPLGRTLTLGGLPFRIIGVFTRQGKAMGFSRDNVVCIPVQVYRKNFMGRHDSLNLQVQARGGVASLDAATDEVRALLRASRHTAFKDPDPFGILTQDVLQALWKQISRAAFVLMLLVASVSLGVGGVVIMNIMLVSVVERTPEIGIRLALGARKRDIARQFLLEAATLSLCGGLAGLAAGAVVTWVVRELVDFPARLTPGIVGASLAVFSSTARCCGRWDPRPCASRCAPSPPRSCAAS